jgi:hypothetical protein
MRECDVICIEKVDDGITLSGHLGESALVDVRIRPNGDEERHLITNDAINVIARQEDRETLFMQWTVWEGVGFVLILIEPCCTCTSTSGMAFMTSKMMVLITAAFLRHSSTWIRSLVCWRIMMNRQKKERKVGMMGMMGMVGMAGMIKMKSDY